VIITTSQQEFEQATQEEALFDKLLLQASTSDFPTPIDFQ
jgi:hypothetical protein